MIKLNLVQEFKKSCRLVNFPTIMLRGLVCMHRYGMPMYMHTVTLGYELSISEFYCYDQRRVEEEVTI